MTRSVEIPEAAVEDALRAFVEHRIDTKESRMRAALDAALPYLAPAGTGAVHLISDGEAVTSCCGRTPFELPRTDRLTVDPKSARGCAPLGDGGNHHWSPRTKERPDAGPVHPCLTCDEKMACTGPSCGLHSVLLGERTGENALAEWLEYVFTTGDDITWEAAAQELFDLGAIREAAGDGGLREALAGLLRKWDEDRATYPKMNLAANHAEVAVKLCGEELADVVAAHPAAPAVPQPATLPMCVNCESETFECSACGSLVEPWESAVPQPVDRKALRKLMRGALDAYVNLGPQGYWVYLDSIAALLAGEQEQVQ